MSGKAEQTVEVFARVCSRIDSGAFGLPSIKTLINWLTTYAFWAMLAVAIIGVIVWGIGSISNHGGAGKGKIALVVGGLGVVILAALPALINALTEVGRQSGRC